MSIITVSNTAVVQQGSNQLPSNTVTFQAANEIGILITKTINRPGELYYEGDTIVFTVTITRATGVTGAINQITITDDIPSVVSFTQAGVQQTIGTGGNISVSGQTVTVSGLVLNNGNPTNTIVVTGIIHVTP